MYPRHVPCLIHTRDRLGRDTLLNPLHKGHHSIVLGILGICSGRKRKVTKLCGTVTTITMAHTRDKEESVEVVEVGLRKRLRDFVVETFGGTGRYELAI